VIHHILNLNPNLFPAPESCSCLLFLFPVTSSPTFSVIQETFD
jgi:hypothetical protein